MSKTLKTIAIAAAGVAVLSAPSFAADKVRLVNSTKVVFETEHPYTCLLYTSPSPRDRTRSRMPSSA